jgi:hypothetical protein
MSKPCEYCGCDLPVGVDKKTRQVRSHHFVICTARPKKDNYEAGKREWVGLTDDQIKAMDSGVNSISSFYAGALWANEKLKELNT